MTDTYFILPCGCTGCLGVSYFVLRLTVACGFEDVISLEIIISI